MKRYRVTPSETEPGFAEWRKADRERKWKLALKNAKKAWNTAKNSDDPLERCQSLVQLAKCAFQYGNSKLALRSVQKALGIYDAENPEPSTPSILIECADLYINMGHYEEAKGILHKRILKRVESTPETVDALNRVGKIFMDEKEPGKALVYFEHSGHMAERLEMREQQIESKWLQGESYSLMGNFSSALQVLWGSCMIANEYKMPIHEALSLARVGEAYLEIDNYAWAEKHYMEARVLLEQVDPTRMSYIHERFISTVGNLNADYEYMLGEYDEYAGDIPKGPHNRILLESMIKRTVALNGLERFEEAQETIVEILDSIGSEYVRHWPVFEKLLTELGSTLRGLDRPEDGKKALDIADRLKLIRTDNYVSDVRKRDQYEILASDLHNFIKYFKEGRIEIFCIRGRVVNFTDRTISGEGYESPEVMTPTEATILNYLASHQGKECKVAELAEEVYPGAKNDPDRDWQSLLKPHVTKLRKKLHDDRGGSLIKPVRNAGWRLAGG